MVDRGDTNSLKREANGYATGIKEKEIEEVSVRIPLNATQKVFVCRDYSTGLDIRFLTHFPQPLAQYISEDTWENTITRINLIFQNADRVCLGSVLETVLGCATCYTVRLFSKSIYEKRLAELDQFLHKQNELIYNPAGLHLLNPMERGLRVIEISLLHVPAAEDTTDGFGLSSGRAPEARLSP